MSRALPRALCLLIAVPLLLVTVLAGCRVEDFLPEPDRGPAAGGSVGQDDEPEASPVLTEVTRVIDGDTIAVAPVEGELEASGDDADEHIVRLLGIDTPEMNYHSGEKPECGAREATEHLESLLSRGTAVVVSYDPEADRTDRYGRSLAYVDLADGGDGTADVAHQQVAGGYAVAWIPSGEPEPERFSDLVTAQQSAQHSGAGSWGTCGTFGRD